MKCNNRMKEIIQEDFNQTENYVAIMSKANKRKKGFMCKLVLCTVSIIFAIVTCKELLPNITNHKDSYFVTTIHAEENEYTMEDDISFQTKVEVYDRMQFPEIGALYANADAVNKKGDLEYSKSGFRVNLKVTGENIEKVTYKVISEDEGIELYRGVSGELQYVNLDHLYPSLWGYDGHAHVEKSSKDLTQEEMELLLELSGYEEYKPEELSENQVFNLINHQELDWDYHEYCDAISNGTDHLYNGGKENQYYKIYYELTKKSNKEADKIFGHFEWDFVENGKELTFPKELLNDNYVIYIVGLEIYEQSKYEANEDRNMLYAKYMTENMKIEVDITYKDGTIKKKTLTYKFKDLGMNEFGFEEYGLEGTLK